MIILLIKFFSIRVLLLNIGLGSQTALSLGLSLTQVLARLHVLNLVQTQYPYSMNRGKFIGVCIAVPCESNVKTNFMYFICERQKILEIKLNGWIHLYFKSVCNTPFEMRCIAVKSTAIHTQVLLNLVCYYSSSTTKFIFARTDFDTCATSSGTRQSYPPTPELPWHESYQHFWV